MRNPKLLFQLVLLVAASSLPSAGQSIATNNAPAMYPASYAVATSEPGSSGKAWITVIDVTGDTIIREQPLTSSTSFGFALDQTGTFGEDIGGGAVLNYFEGNTALLPGTVGVNSLPSASCVVNATAPVNHLLALDINNNALDTASANGTPGAYALSADATVPTTPVSITGSAVTQRYAVISQNVPYGVACNNIATQVPNPGSVTFYQIGSNSVITGNVINVGKCPVFGVTSADGQRSFILNRGDDTISVLNLNTAALDLTSALTTTGSQHAGPVHAEYVASTGKLLVANYDNDTVSVVNVQTDSKGADGPQFGRVVATIDLWNGNAHQCPVLGQPNQFTPCSKHPATISALPDGSRAYVAAQGAGEIDIIDLSLNQMVGALPLPVPAQVVIHPRTVATVAYSTTNSLFSRVYVGAPDSSLIPFIYASDNFMVPGVCGPGSNVNNQGGLCTADGNLSDIHVSSQTPSNGNQNQVYSTRLPGAGEPCASAKFSPANISDCLAH